MKKKPELLLPAGESKSVYMAFSAGADAVYLGAPLFSARSYAKNLEVDEIIKALDYAHLFGKKIYLACNILMRNSELKLLPDIMDPLYEHGLDGVIVQDMGLLQYFGKRYPYLPLHASTQMSILSSEGCEWLKRHKVVRVVPGRELSLEEIKALKETGLEVECFIHGAMCYSYSGRCLLSSLAGGRSGNRGKCAGPCRQRYTAENGKSGYLLSMKDMNSVNSIPELIDAGVDSFKIEGRMKAPEYVAGTAKVYRKCIDSYVDGGHMEISGKDRDMLDKLYIRSERQEGYLHRHNGPEMISMASPSYSGGAEEYRDRLANEYSDKRLKHVVDMKLILRKNEEASLKVSCKDKEIYAGGGQVQEARKAPMTVEEIVSRLSKTGDTVFEAGEIVADIDENIFMPVSAINELRRNALNKLEKEMLKDCMRKADKKAYVYSETERTAVEGEAYISVAVRTEEQLRAVRECLRPDRIVLPFELFAYPEIWRGIKENGTRVFMAMPEIVREKDLSYIIKFLDEYSKEADGIVAGSIDALELAKKYFDKEQIHGDASLYAMNDLSAGMILEECASFTLCPEQNRREYEKSARTEHAELNVYGRVPVMISAGCVLKNTENCDPQQSMTYIKDETGRRFPVLLMHKMCYNVILNCVPTSLHKEFRQLYTEGEYAGFNFSFTVESGSEVKRVIKLFEEERAGKDTECTYDFTRGHFKRGAE